MLMTMGTMAIKTRAILTTACGLGFRSKTNMEKRKRRTWGGACDMRVYVPWPCFVWGGCVCLSVVAQSSTDLTAAVASGGRYYPAEAMCWHKDKDTGKVLSVEV